MPELDPLVPAIVKALDTVGKIETILQPAVTRIQEGQPAIFEIADAAPKINEIMPDVAAAIATLAKVREIAAKYEAAIEARIA